MGEVDAASEGAMDVKGTRSGDVLRGGAGNDRLWGYAGDDDLAGRAGDDQLFGGDGDDLLAGGAGADRLYGGAGIDVADYGDASSRIVIDFVNPANNRGDAVGDTFASVENFIGSAFDDVMRVTGEIAVLFGGAGDDKLVGAARVSYLVGGAGADQLVGRGERSSAVYWDSPVGLTADLADPSRNTGFARGDSYENIDDLEGTDFSDRLYGNDGDNLITGFTGADLLAGGGGDDLLDGGAGGDRLFGGSGLDRAVYWGAAAGVAADLISPQRNRGEAAGDVYVSIEGLDGSDFADDLRGDGARNVLFGGGGDDLLFGRGGADRLFGEEGADRLDGGGGADLLDGGSGADRLDGGGGRDRAVHRDAAAGVTADLASPSRNRGEAAGDVYRSIEDLEGSDFADDLRGDAGDNQLFGRGGGDMLLGRGGNDSLFGGGGRDRLFGGDGADDLHGGRSGDEMDGGGGDGDRAVYWEASAGVTADLAMPSRNRGDAAGDVYRGIEGLDGSDFADALRGNGVNNDLFGGRGDDLLSGRGGDDNLFGGLGRDRLFGGAGADDFIFAHAPGAADADDVRDFAPGIDRIVLLTLAFPDLAEGAVRPSAFALGEAATAASHRLIYDAGSGELSYDADGAGAAADALLVARFTRGLAIDADDFLVFAV